VSDQLPMVGGIYRHYKGGLYTVLHIAQVEGTKERVVVYRGADGHVWTRPVYQWFAQINPQPPGVPCKRFEFAPQEAEQSGRT
jgi:hypothetical protein